MQHASHAVYATHIQQAFVCMPWGFCATGLTVRSEFIHDCKLLLTWTTNPRI